MGERAVRTRRKPGGGKRREPLGARRRTCQIASFTPGSRNTAFPVHRPSDVSPGANQASPNAFHESRITKHESRPFIVCFDRRVVRNAGQCPRAARSLLACALWGGYGAAWAAYCPRAGVRAPSAVRCEIPQKWTESRISESKHEAQRSPRFPSPLSLHVSPSSESRDTNHKTRPFRFTGRQTCRLVPPPPAARRGSFEQETSGSVSWLLDSDDNAFHPSACGSCGEASRRLPRGRPTDMQARGCFRSAVRVKSPVEGAAGSCGRSARSEEDGDPGDLLRRTTKPTALGGRLRVQGSKIGTAVKKMSVAQRVTRHFRPTAQRVQRRVP